MPTSKKEYQASCNCRNINIRYSGEIERSSICHCTECQKRTGSVYGVQVRLNASKLEIQGSSIKKYTRVSDQGNQIIFSFCDNCGSTLFWENKTHPDTIIAALGCFDNIDTIQPAISVYEDRMHKWVIHPRCIQKHIN